MSLLIQMALPALVLVLFAAPGIGHELQLGDQLALPGGGADLKLSNSGGTDENLNEVQEQKNPETTATESLNFGNEATFETEASKPEVKSTSDVVKKNQKQYALELSIFIVFTWAFSICIVLLFLLLSDSEPAQTKEAV
ncbi:uncharacterized protein LOC135944337 [Cloeon dipterum]|uniref:uncharacterized protein LOC135944337 n=1 Tax=Cloeon dipterum TaxID=197152 RepID=UPI0032205177